MASAKRAKVQDNLENIQKWCEEGKSVKWIAKKLDVSRSLLYQMMKEEREAGPQDRKNGLLDTVKKGRESAVGELEDTMMRKALGFTRKVKKYQKVKRCEYEGGRKKLETEEMVEYEEEVYYPPDDTAAIFLLKNWGKYANDPAGIHVREREVDLKEKTAEQNNW